MGTKEFKNNEKNNSSLAYVIIKYGFQRLAEKTKVVNRGNKSIESFFKI